MYGAIGKCMTDAASFTTLQCIATVIMGTERASLTDANLAFLLQYVMI